MSVKLAGVLEAVGCSPERAAYWGPPVAGACNEYGIDSPLKIAAFVAQIAHESNLFQALEENLNYSAKALRTVFKKYFPDEQSAKLAERQPQVIGNIVYANRMGNGDAASGDGYKFRGRGLIQLTGRSNYEACGKALGMDLISTPEMLRQPIPAARSAGWFWQGHGLNDLAGKCEFEKITRRINGGLNGQEHRLELYNKAQLAIGI